MDSLRDETLTPSRPSSYLETDDRFFKPTTTSDLLIRYLGDLKGATVLDLGCGIGPIAIAAALGGAEKVYATDVMAGACEIAQRNARKHSVANAIDFRVGHLFESVAGLKFDLIVCDVSGMADSVSRISPWYPPTIPTGGPDGTTLTVEAIRQSVSYLKEGGTFLFPTISLARSERLIDLARNVFKGNLLEVERKFLPFPREFYSHLESLEKLRSEGVIHFTKRGSRYLWELRIYKGMKLDGGADVA